MLILQPHEITSLRNILTNENSKTSTRVLAENVIEKITISIRLLTPRSPRTSSGFSDVQVSDC